MFSTIFLMLNPNLKFDFWQEPENPDNPEKLKLLDYWRFPDSLDGNELCI